MLGLIFRTFFCRLFASDPSAANTTGVVAMQPHIWGPNKPAKYGSTAEAIVATVDAFCTGLEKLRNAGHTVLVHPVRPAPLDHPGNGSAAAKRTEEWHNQLQSRLRGMSNIVYLDFFYELCCVPSDASPAVCGRCGSRVSSPEEAAGPRLCRRFDVGDGVHMNREYMHIFTRHLREAISLTLCQ